MAHREDSAYRLDGATVYQDTKVIATFDEAWRAQQWLEKLETPSEEWLYWKDVRDMAESIESELEDQIKEGTRGETLREWLSDHIHESIDGCARVIYTHQAQQCLLFSSNDGAYEEEFGPDGMVEDGCIMWSRLAYAAFRADVYEQLETNGVDVNNPGPKCETCDEDDAEHEHDGAWYCDTCIDDALPSAEEDEDEEEEEATTPEVSQ